MVVYVLYTTIDYWIVLADASDAMSLSWSLSVVSCCWSCWSVMVVCPTNVLPSWLLCYYLPISLCLSRPGVTCEVLLVQISTLSLYSIRLLQLSSLL